MAGHSFGGVNAYCTGVKNKSIKGLVMIDPWFLMEDKIMDEDFPHPMLIINSCTSENILPHL